MILVGFQIQWRLEYHTLEYLSFEVQISNGLVLEWPVIAIVMVPNILNWTIWNPNKMVAILLRFPMVLGKMATTEHHQKTKRKNFGKYFDLVLLVLVSTVVL